MDIYQTTTEYLLKLPIFDSWREIPLHNKATVDSVIAAIIAPVQRLSPALAPGESVDTLCVIPQVMPTTLAAEANLEG